MVYLDYWRAMVGEYTDWYEGYLARYERDIAAEGRRGWVEWGRNTGLPILRSLADQIVPQTDEQQQVLQDVLNGFRQLGVLVTELEGRGQIIRRYPIETLKQCHEVLRRQ